MPLLMPDDFSELNLVAWRVELGTADPSNPLIEGDQPWDAGGVGIHGSVFKDPIDKLWKAYLVCTPAEDFPEKQAENTGKPWASENAAHRRVCLFESKNGIHWTRPKLANVSFGKHERTNIIFDVTDGVSAYSSMLVDPANRDWPYAMFVLRESWGAVKGKAPQGNTAVTLLIIASARRGNRPITSPCMRTFRGGVATGPSAATAGNGSATR
ncbi:MAG: hypothetical protein E6J01_18075 [Chloroflexi bacterium]|nr:MAG: hypothetical protein E6J01_18075 [Chloroflexota bacterium]